MRVISIYQEHQSKFHSIPLKEASRPPPLPPRKGRISPLKAVPSMNGEMKVAKWVENIPDGEPVDEREVFHSNEKFCSLSTSKNFIAIPTEDGHMETYHIDTEVLQNLAHHPSDLSIESPDATTPRVREFHENDLEDIPQTPKQVKSPTIERKKTASRPIVLKETVSPSSDSNNRSSPPAP
jgi:hypothetical protein